APAKGHSVRRNHYGNTAIANPHHGILKVFDGEVQFIPIAFNSHGEDHGQVGANAEIGTLIADHQAVVFPFGKVDGFVQSRQNAAAECVHFGTEFKIQNAVAEILN